MADEIADTLRSMAEHRGLKLVKSRRRKPGTGDYGKFGLTDGDGKPLLGIGDEGLSASADDIEHYLRAGAASTWKVSAEETPARAPPVKDTFTADAPAEKELLAIRPRPRPVPERRRGSGPRSRRAEKPDDLQVRAPASKAAPRPAPERGRRVERGGATESDETPDNEDHAEPELVIRRARPADADALASLLKQLVLTDIDTLDVARNLEAARKAGGGAFVAERGLVVGCCGWAIVPTLQHGAIGRLTVLLVDERHRRRGIATALLAAATETLGKAGCARVEAMSDIEIKNAHNFFRDLKFEQTSYRFARQIDVP